MNQQPLDNPFSSPQSDFESESTFKPIHAELNYAGFFSRFFAWIIDFILSYFFSMTVVVALELLIISQESRAFDWIYQVGGYFGFVMFFIILFALIPITFWLYFALMESSPLQAGLGKRLMGLKVTDLAGERIRFGTATKRHFAHYLSSVFLIGFLVQPFHPRKQAWHDRLCDTVVIRQS